MADRVAILRASLVILLLGVGAVSQDPPRTTSAKAVLTINREYEPFMFLGLTFKHPESKKKLDGMPTPGTTYLATAAGGVKVGLRVHDATGKVAAITVDCNGDGDLGDERTHEVANKDKVRVDVTRPDGDGVKGALPYSLGYQVLDRPDGSKLAYVSWSTNYRAEGTIKAGGAETKVTFNDMDCNGAFDRRDFRGTVLGIDCNSDGKIAGRTEHLWGAQIIPFAGKHWLLDQIAKDGTFLTFTETNLPIPTVGSPLPPLRITMDDGSVIDTKAPGKKPVLLFLWGYR